MRMVTSDMHVKVSQYGFTAEAKTSVLTTVANTEGSKDAAGYYKYRLRKENGEWKIAHLKW